MNQIRMLWVFFFFFFFFCAKIQISLRSLISRFKPASVLSGSAIWDDCGRTFPDELRVNSFPWYVPTLCMGSIANPFRLRWVKSSRMFTCYLLPALLAEYTGSFTCHRGNTGVERAPNKSQHRCSLRKRKISSRFCRNSNSQPCDRESGGLSNELFQPVNGCVEQCIFF